MLCQLTAAQPGPARWLWCVCLLAGCGASTGDEGTVAPTAGAPTERMASSTAAPATPFLLTVVGTNDLHGHVEALPMFFGHVDVLRDLRRTDGAVLVVDAGDMFQGTLVSNHTEGAVVVRAMNAGRTAAVAIGNHEFDYGPVGPAAVVETAGQDRRGALLARVREANFAVLSANLHDRQTGAPVAWEGVSPSTMLQFGPVQVGVIGGTTEELLETTLAANVDDLQVAPLAEAVAAEAARLRDQGAQVVVLVAHAGAKCDEFTDPDDLSVCDEDEIIQVARSLPAGLVDVIVAGHTHRAVAHRIHGIAVIESHAYGKAFGRVDLEVFPDGRVRTSIHPPRWLFAHHETPAADCVVRPEDSACRADPYEGVEVVPNRSVAAAIREDMERSAVLRMQPLGVSLAASMAHQRLVETPLSNWIADAMREAHGGDVALINGGGIRRSLEAGPLDYGTFYELYPFDNRYAVATMRASELAALLRENLEAERGFLSVSGIRADSECQGGELRVALRDGRGRRVSPTRTLQVVMSDYLATMPSPVLSAVRGDNRIKVEDGQPIREQIVRLWRSRQEDVRVDPTAGALREKRVRYTGERPLRCPARREHTRRPARRRVHGTRSYARNAGE